MVNEVDRIGSRAKRHARVRARLSGSQERPRLCIYRSLGHIYVQAVDDGAMKTLAHASTLEMRKGKGVKYATEVIRKKAGKAGKTGAAAGG